MINQQHGRPRRLFSYAHEYCHTLVDRSRQGTVSSASNRDELFEVRANAFAAQDVVKEERRRQSRCAKLAEGAPQGGAAVWPTSRSWLQRACHRGAVLKEFGEFMTSADECNAASRTRSSCRRSISISGCVSGESRRSSVRSSVPGEVALSLGGNDHAALSVRVEQATSDHLVDQRRREQVA